MAGGRPTKYDKKYAKIAQKMCELGATVPDLAEAINVAESTIRLWAVQHSEFSAALRVGREPADDAVERSLFERALGYTHEDVDIRVIEGQIVKTPIIKHYPPDSKAALAWLYNRRGEKWHPSPEQAQKEVPPITINIVNPDGTDSAD